MAPIDIQLISATEFAKLAHEEPLLVGSIKPWTERASAKASVDDESLTDADVSALPDHIPACYHDYADVFSKARSDILPECRPYDHAIDLEPGAAIPYGLIYRLSEVELATLREISSKSTLPRASSVLPSRWLARPLLGI